MLTRVAVTLICLLVAVRPALAQGGPTREALYQQHKKSVGLAVTLEALCPIAGAGALYAGDSDKGTLLAVLSAASAGVAVGSLFYLIHLEHQNPGGVDRVFFDVENGAAWTGLVVGGAIYLLTRVSGLSLAPDAVGAFNVDLRQRLGASALDSPVRYRSQATTAALIWRF